MINAIAIDDEPKAVSIIASHISKIEDVVLLHKFYDPKKALDFLKENPVDLVFIDINMPHLSGLELLQELQTKPLLIFTTAYAEYALESYNYNAVDYLLKPFDFERFKLAINKTRERLKNDEQQNTFFFIKDGLSTIKIKFDEILLIKGSGNYLDIVTQIKTHSPRMTFNDMLDKVPSNFFIRTHQSYLVNLNHIDKIENNHIFLKELKIPISSKYKEITYRRLGVE